MQIPKGKWQVLGEVAAHCKVYREGKSTVTCAKTVEMIEMPFGNKTQVGVGSRNHLLDAGPDPPPEGALLMGCPSNRKAL